MTPADVDFIVVGTTTPDLIFPNTGTLLQQRLDIHGCPAFSLETACSGFIYALSIADKYVRVRRIEVRARGRRRVPVAFRGLDRSRDGRALGDGAGAVILTPADEPGIIGTHLHSDGKYQDLLYFPYGVSNGIRHAAQQLDCDGLKMQGNEVFKVAVRTLSRTRGRDAREERDRAQRNRLACPHQANLRIIQSAADKLGLPMEKVVVTVQDHGNTSAASIPLALDTAVRDGRIHRDQLLLLETFGGGFTWGSALIRY